MEARIRVGNRNETRVLTGRTRIEVRDNDLGGLPRVIAYVEHLKRRYKRQGQSTVWRPWWWGDMVGVDPEARELLAALNAEVLLRSAAFDGG